MASFQVEDFGGDKS